MNFRQFSSFALVFSFILTMAACGGGAKSRIEPPPVSTITGVSVSPSSVTIGPGDTKQFTATVSGTGSYSSAVTWTATGGTISASGMLAAPAATGSVTVTATSVQDGTKTGTATVSVANSITGVTVSPSTVTLNPGEQKQFTATVTGTGTFVNTVNWTATAGTISPSGLLTAPVTGSSVTVTATSVGDNTKSGTAAVTMANAVSGVAVSCTPNSAQIGSTTQCSATVTGTGTFTSGVTWKANGTAGGNSTVGTVSSSGLYTTPYPAPASVTISATSTFTASVSGSTDVTLSAPALASGPALTIDAAATTHPINPLIYGMNFYPGNPSDRNYASNLANAKAARVTVDRWGGNATTRYNYQLDVTNIGGDWYYETLPNQNTNSPDVSEFNSQVAADISTGAKTLCTVPVIGWTAKRARACSFSVTKYGAQKETDPWWSDCGRGVKLDGSNITNDPNDTSTPIDETWAGGWATYLKNKFGDAAHGGVAIYALDNEPTWWEGNHKDVHPQSFTYDEVTNNGLKVAKAVKTADPTSEVTGPVIDFWPAYFYSMKDIHAGWNNNGKWNSNPIDRLAHGNVPLLEYYLQQFKAAQDADATHRRFLDYLDLHTYFSAGNFASAGTTDQQQALIDSTRALWDPTYVNSNYQDPDTYQPTAPRIIRRMKTWIANDYPGTKTAITEYNWGMQEHIAGGIAQADVLGIFGREGLDLGTLWGPPITATTDTYGNPITPQYPGLIAFKMFRNYDGANGEFGDMGIAASSADQGKLSVYAAMRTADNVLTLVVINKTFGDLKTDLPLANFTASGAAKVYQYTSADLQNIKQLADITVPAPPSGQTTSTIPNVTFPAMSITVLEIPKG